MCRCLGGLVLWILLGSVRCGSGQVPGLEKEIRPAWPTHTVCSADGVHITYTSCDPVQDVGISLTPCPPVHGHPINLRLSALLRYSVQELYLSADIVIAGRIWGHYDETLCMPDFPRYFICNRLRGEIIHFENSIKVRWHSDLNGVKLGAHAVLLNQDGHSVACVNFTVNMQEV